MQHVLVRVVAEVRAVGAYQPATRAEAVSILVWLGVIVALAVVAAIVGFVIWRRYTHSDDAGPTRSTAFTLADLRQLHRQGQLSDEEFERARTAIIAQTRAALATDDTTDLASDTGPEDDAQADKPDDDKPSGEVR